MSREGQMETAPFVYVLRIRPGGEHGGRVWEVAWNRPPTTLEAIRHLQEQRRAPGQVDHHFAAACVEALRDLGVPESYRPGSQGAEPWDGGDSEAARIELHLMRFVQLAWPNST
jgi:hypothetical protein